MLPCERVWECILINERGAHAVSLVNVSDWERPLRREEGQMYLGDRKREGEEMGGWKRKQKRSKRVAEEGVRNQFFLQGPSRKAFLRLSTKTAAPSGPYSTLNSLSCCHTHTLTLTHQLCRQLGLLIKHHLLIWLDNNKLSEIKQSLSACC